MIYIQIFTILIITIVFLLNINFISNLLNLYDHPDSNRKIHSVKISNIGGIGIFLIIIFNFLSSFFFQELNMNGENIDLNGYFFIFSFFFLILGVLDDKYNLSALTKIIILIFMILVFIFLNNEIEIISLNFRTFDKEISLGSYSIVFTIFCFFAFSHALNMFDGVNGNVVLYSLFIFIFLYFRSYNVIFINLIIYLIIFFIFNYKNKIFLGNNGSLLLSFLISYFCVSLHNNNQIYADEIYLIMLIPGLDMVRLFFQRILKKKSPFTADNNHIHHIFLTIVGIKKYLIGLLIILLFTYYFLYFDLVFLGILFVKVIYIFFIKYKFFFNKL